jgi:hypothetical protein
MIALFHNNKGEKKFESSDIISVGDAYYVVYDNLYSIGRIAYDIPFRSDRNILLGNKTGDSGYEAIVYDEINNLFYIVVEAVPKEETNEKHKVYNALIEEIEMVDKTNDAAATIRSKAVVSYEPKVKCPAQFQFSSQNKGFEGAVSVRIEDNFYLLGLCEGNHCEGGKRGRDAGNGRIVVMKKIQYNNKENCLWKTIHVLDLPKSANFVDYSAISIQHIKHEHNKYKIAITSQESSEVWLSELTIINHKTAKDWIFTEGYKLDFPRNDQCQVIYCNIEGIAFLGENMLVAVSDKMKANSKQPFRCFGKDQSIHLFVIP